jgi:phytoene synthase
MQHGAGEPTKRPGDENFPVASLVLARGHRASVLAFYRFVRMADDIADAPDLPGDEKLSRLVALDAALGNPNASLREAVDLQAVSARHGTGVEEARLLLSAFRQDATLRRYETWEGLLDYCARSANPVGRFLLRLHGEEENTFAPADALCTALQILNHLQDLKPDRECLDRIYLPVPWMERAGGEAAFFSSANGAARRRVLDAALDQVDALTDRARALPGRVRNGRLRAQSAATIALADALSQRLRRQDPILTRVEVSKVDVARGFLGGLVRAVRPDPHLDARLATAAVRRSGSSFSLGMRSLPRERRRAIHAVYAFCRAVDDIADGAAPPQEKRRFLDLWRREIDRLHAAPETPVGRELARAGRQFELPAQEYHALLDGMETDSADRVRLPDEAALDLYSRRVAGSVGCLSIRIFGVPQAHDFALTLGRTLQLVNILRDVDEDAAIERVYVPLSHLRRLGLEDGPAPALVADPRFARACHGLAVDARAGFDAADRALASLDRAALKPAILMMEGYRRILDRLERRGFGTRRGRLRLTTSDRLQLLSLALRPA